MRQRLALTFALLALLVAAPRADDPGLVEPMFVDGVMPPAANGLQVGLGAMDGAYAAPSVQLDFVLAEGLGASFGFGLLVTPGRPDAVALASPSARFKWAVLGPATGRPAVVLGASLTPSTRSLSQGEAGLTLGLAHQLGAVTLELVTGAESRTTRYLPEALLGASAGLALSPRWRLVAELRGETGPDHDLCAASTVGYQLDARTLLMAGVAVGLTADTPALQAALQVRRDL